MRKDQYIIDDPHPVDTRTFVEREWDARVMTGRQNLMKKLQVPQSLMLASVYARKGTAHTLDPSKEWLRWDRTAQSLFRAMEPKPMTMEELHAAGKV